MFSLAADSGGIHDIDNAHADFTVVCHRADSTADLSELCHNSYDLPDVRGLSPETQVGLSRYSVTIKLCDSYCLGIGDYQVVQ